MDPCDEDFILLGELLPGCPCQLLAHSLVCCFGWPAGWQAGFAALWISVSVLDGHSPS